MFMTLLHDMTDYKHNNYDLSVSGWVVGSLEILGSPASLVRSIGNGVSDFFRLPYEGLTRGPGAFVSGVSRGTTSFVKHISKGNTDAHKVWFILKMLIFCRHICNDLNLLPDRCNTNCTRDRLMCFRSFLQSRYRWLVIEEINYWYLKQTNICCWNVNLSDCIWNEYNVL